MQIQFTPFPIYREQIYNILPTLVIEKSVFSIRLFIFERTLTYGSLPIRTVRKEQAPMH